MAELARRVHLGASATTERVRRMESTGIIRGYRAVIDFGAVGVSVLAVVRLEYLDGTEVQVRRPRTGKPGRRVS